MKRRQAGLGKSDANERFWKHRGEDQRPSRCKKIPAIATARLSPHRDATNRSWNRISVSNRETPRRN
ncbi:hypothetical protein BVI2075_90008 [Burkholderia vietnamiensis]|nr:hypothetical protein BVI2075_90008 [Burkholderia vietnamiensis]